MMITRIKVSNFYGVKDPVEVSFIEGGEKEKIGYAKFGKERVSLISGFYGANASGKSTIFNAIDVIARVMVSRQQDVINGIKQNIIFALPNYHISMQTKPIVMEIDFIIDEDKYYYSFSIINEGSEIAQEVLYKNKKEIFSRKDNKISFEAGIRKKIGATLTEDVTAPKKSSFLSVLLDDSSGISVFNNLKEIIGVSKLNKIKTDFCFITDKRSVQIGQNNISGLLNFALRYISGDKNTKDSLNIVNPITKFFEPSFDHFIIEGDQKSFKFDAQYSNFYKHIPIMELSAGTRELVTYIGDIIRILKNGGVVIYDETSKFYHPDMEIAILNLFKDKNINQKNAQLFFSSHNHETFDILQNDQAHIVEKKNDNITISKVSDFNVKERDNIKRIYRLGSIGGVPDTIDFNRVINNLL